jgi:putative transposase
MQKCLIALSFPVGRWKMAKLVKEVGVCIRYQNKYKAKKNSKHKKPVFKNELEKISSTNNAINHGLVI